MVKIIEKRDSAEKPGDAKHVEYYVHYEAFNRRLDTWVSLLDFDLGTLEKPRAKETSDAQPNKDDGEKDPKKKKHKKDNDKNDVKVENDGVAAENRMKGHGGHGNAHPLRHAVRRVRVVPPAQRDGHHAPHLPPLASPP